MTATNHAITGAIIATLIDKPIIALPLALASHFVTDMLPHFGFAGHGGYKAGMKRRLQKIVMVADLVLFIPFILILLHYHVPFWTYAAAFLALCPDFHDFLAYFLFGKNNGWNWFSKWAGQIQWCERPWGIIVEIVWYVGGLAILVNLLS